VITPHVSAVVTTFIARDGFQRPLVNLAIADGRQRRQRERDRTFMAPRQYRFETQPHRQHLAGERRLDGFARQPQGFVIEQRRRGDRRLVSGYLPPARGIA
jgi:hypothetical protein